MPGPAQQQQYGAQSVKALKSYKRYDEALATMNRIADQVLPICVAHKWTVATMEEFNPTNSGLMGVNVGRFKICIRLRTPQDSDAFFPFEYVLGTALHELAHMVHGAHSADFYRLLDSLRDECEKLMAQGITGRNMPWAGTGHALGGGAPPPDQRSAAAAAAERRARSVGMAPAGGQRLGGLSGAAGPMCRESVRLLRLSAAERRREDAGRCVATQDGVSLEPDGPCSADGGARSAAAEHGSGGWTCGTCTLRNPLSAQSCAACGGSRADATTANGGGSAGGCGGSASAGPGAADGHGASSGSTAAGSGGRSASGALGASAGGTARVGAASSAKAAGAVTGAALERRGGKEERAAGPQRSAPAPTAAAAAKGVPQGGAAVGGRRRPQPQPGAAAQWRCVLCNYINTPVAPRCSVIGCGAARPGAPAAAQRPASAHVSSAASGRGGGARGGSGSGGEKGEKGWSCHVCTLYNAPLALMCMACSAVRRTDDGANSSAAAAAAGGDGGSVAFAGAAGAAAASAAGVGGEGGGGKRQRTGEGDGGGGHGDVAGDVIDLSEDS